MEPIQPTPIAHWNPVRDVWETGAGGLFCEHSGVYSETWPRSGMTRNGSAFELPTWEPATGAGGSSLLPTPRVSDANGPGLHGTGGQDLRTAVANL